MRLGKCTRQLSSKQTGSNIACLSQPPQQWLLCTHALVKPILQAPLVDKSRPLGASMPFKATTTAKADYTAPTKRAERHRRTKAELVPSAPLTNATMYRWGCWHCHPHACMPCMNPCENHCRAGCCCTSGCCHGRCTEHNVATKHEEAARPCLSRWLVSSTARSNVDLW